MSRWPALLGGVLCLTLQVSLGQTGFGGLGGFGSGVGSGVGSGASSAATSHFTFAPYLSVQGYYSRAVGPLSLSFQDRRDTFGYSGMGGITAGRRWERTSLMIGYTGGVTHNSNLYSSSTYSNRKWTQSHNGVVGVNHMFTPRLTVSVSEMAGTSIGGTGGQGIAGGLGNVFGLGSLGNYDYAGGSSFISSGNYQQNGLVDGELFNRRVNYTASTGALSYRLSERWFTTASGTGAFVRREGSLFGSDSQSVSGQIGYLFSSRTEVGLVYSEYWNQTTNLFGGVRARSSNLSFTRRINPRASISLMAGGVEVRSNFVGSVPVPAEIAELTGQTASYEVRKVHYFSAGFGGSFSQRFHTSSMSVSVNRGFSPGNGVLLAGVRDMAFVTYSMFENHRVGLQAVASASRTTSSLSAIRRSEYYSVGMGTSVRVYKQILTSFGAGYREIRLSGIQNGRSLYASVGLIWSPREFALAF